MLIFHVAPQAEADLAVSSRLVTRRPSLYTHLHLLENETWAQLFGLRCVWVDTLCYSHLVNTVLAPFSHCPASSQLLECRMPDFTLQLIPVSVQGFRLSSRILSASKKLFPVLHSLIHQLYLRLISFMHSFLKCINLFFFTLPFPALPPCFLTERDFKSVTTLQNNFKFFKR